MFLRSSETYRIRGEARWSCVAVECGREFCNRVQVARSLCCDRTTDIRLDEELRKIARFADYLIYRGTFSVLTCMTRVQISCQCQLSTVRRSRSRFCFLRLRLSHS
jgi:hypothetical protein